MFNYCVCSMHTACTKCWMQAEGEVMSRKNGELEGALRKVRTQVRKLESDRDRLASRLASLESSLAGEQERALHATQAAALQVLQVPQSNSDDVLCSHA